MAIAFVTSIRAAQQALSTFVMAHGAALPAWASERLIAAMSAPSTVDRIVRAGEALYAARDEISPAAREMCAVLIQFATMQSWQGLHVDGRGSRIVQAMQRDNGEAAPVGMDWPDPVDDPAVRKGFEKPEEEEEPA